MGSVKNMKKAKFLFKVDKNNRAKIYINNKWLKDVTRVILMAEPWEYRIIVEQYKRNAEGVFYVENNEVARKTTIYKVGKKD